MRDPQEQFLEAYTKYADDLFRYAFFRIHDRESAKDLLQETFMKTWRYMSDTRHSSIDNLRAFLYRILTNLVIDEYRKKKPVDSLETMNEEEGFDPKFDDTDRWVDQLDGEQALNLLKMIPEPYREAVFMRYVGELSLTEIATATGISENTAAVRIHRGIEKLRKIYGK